MVLFPLPTQVFSIDICVVMRHPRLVHLRTGRTSRHIAISNSHHEADETEIVSIVIRPIRLSASDPESVLTMSHHRRVRHIRTDLRRVTIIRPMTIVQASIRVSRLSSSSSSRRGNQ